MLILPLEASIVACRSFAASAALSPLSVEIWPAPVPKVMAVAVERQHGVDQVLDGPGSGQIAVLGHVADQDNGYPGGLGQSGQPVDTGSDLGQAPGRLGQGGIGDGLDRVHHGQGGTTAIDGGGDGGHVVTLDGQQLDRHRPHDRRRL